MKNHNTKVYSTPIQLKLPVDLERIIKINDFIKYELSSSLEEIFDDINSYIFGQLGVDLNHAYIDGTKIEANANKYTWVWKKSCIKSGNNIYGSTGTTHTGRVTSLLAMRILWFVPTENSFTFYDPHL